MEKHGEPRDLNELQRHRVVAAGPQITWRFEGPDGPVSFKPHTIVETNSSEACSAALSDSHNRMARPQAPNSPVQHERRVP